MIRIRGLELRHDEGPALTSSSYPWMRHEEEASREGIEESIASARVDDFVPCHYFDFMAGISTGG